MKPKISVIMSVYNGLPFVKNAIRSILSQTYKNFEVIIIDDASTDKSWQYLKSLKEKRIKLIRNHKNLGLAASLNIALRQAQGVFVARMDADDISSPQRFETQLNFLLKNPKIDLCGSWVDLINENGDKVGELKYPSSDKEIKKSLARFNPIVHPTFFAKKALFESLGGYRPEYDKAEDYDLLVRAMKNFKFANVREKLLSFRLGKKRRSSFDMARMDRLEINIKIDLLKNTGFNITGAFWILKKIITTYLIPINLKIQLARILKLT